MHVPPARVQFVREIGQCLRRVAKAVQQQHSLACSRSLTDDRLGAFDDPIWSNGKPQRHAAGDPPRASSSRRRECRDGQDERDDRSRHATRGRWAGGFIAGIVTRRC